MSKEQVPPKHGKVRDWFDNRGFGYIEPEEVRESAIFVHRNEVNSDGNGRVSLRPGQRVSYEVGADSQGRSRAENVQVLEGTSTVAIDPGQTESAQVGTVRMYNEAKGFGFIAREGKPDLFFHYKGWDLAIYDPDDDDPVGLEVIFDVVPSDRGPKAKNIRPVSNPSWQERPGDTREGSNR